MSCTPNCLACNPTLPTLCQQCQNNFILTQTGTCQLPCADPYNLCISCDPSDPEECNSCTPIASVLDDDECERAPTCKGVKKCVACDVAEPSRCGACKLGFHVQNNVCVSCPRNCQNCTSVACLTCEIGHQLINGNCDACSPGYLSHGYECDLDCDESGVQGCKKCRLQGGINRCRSCGGMKMVKGDKCAVNVGAVIGLVCGLVFAVILIVVLVIVVLRLLKQRTGKAAGGVSVTAINNKEADAIDEPFLE